jgi:elongation factor Ts
MIEGRMRNFFSEVVLEEQPFIKDDKQSVGQIATAGGLKLKGFTMWKVGEGAA